MASLFDLSQSLLLVSSMFLTRTSCCKITRTDGYCASWPGWTVSVSVFPEQHCRVSPPHPAPSKPILGVRAPWGYVNSQRLWDLVEGKVTPGA